MKSELVVPRGRDPHGNLVRPSEAIDGVRYVCPEDVCRRELLLHRGRKRLKSGNVKITHFHHRDTRVCTPESVQHYIAKHLIAKRINTNLPLPKIVGPCPRCGKHSTKEWPASFGGARAKTEARLLNGRVADVGIFAADDTDYERPVALIEVFYSHLVDDDKRTSLREAHIPWFEVGANEILEEPDVWTAIACSRPTRFLCGCKLHDEKCDCYDCRRRQRRIIVRVPFGDRRICIGNSMMISHELCRRSGDPNSWSRRPPRCDDLMPDRSPRDDDWFWGRGRYRRRDYSLSGRRPDPQSGPEKFRTCPHILNGRSIRGEE